VRVVNGSRWRHNSGRHSGGVGGGKLEAKRGQGDWAVVAEGDVNGVRVEGFVGRGCDINTRSSGEGGEKKSFELRMHVLPVFDVIWR
jgi:hypothetical protein